MKIRRSILILLCALLGLGAAAWFALTPGGRGAEAGLTAPRPAIGAALALELRHDIEDALHAAGAAPGAPEPLSRLGRLYHANGLPKLARAAYEAALSAGESGPRTPYFLGLLCAEAGDAPAAVAAFRLALRRDDGYAPAWRHLALALLDADDVDDAARAAATAVRLDATDPAVFIAEARVRRRLRQDALAEAALRKALALDPGHPAATQLLGLVLNALGRNGEGAELLSRARPSRAAVVRDPWFLDVSRLSSGVEGRIAEAEFYIEAGRPKEAARLLREADGRHPGRADVLEKLGFARVRSGDLEAAAEAYRRAVAAAPADAGLRGALATLLLDLGESDAAGREAERALALDPALPTARAVRAIRLHRAGDSAAAAADLEDLLRDHPGEVAAQVTLGDARVALGRVAESVESYREAVKRRPDFAYAHRRLGLALERLGRRTEAVDALRHACRLDPADRDAADALRRLGSPASAAGHGR